MRMTTIEAKGRAWLESKARIKSVIYVNMKHVHLINCLNTQFINLLQFIITVVIKEQVKQNSQASFCSYKWECFFWKINVKYWEQQQQAIAWHVLGYFLCTTFEPCMTVSFYCMDLNHFGKNRLLTCHALGFPSLVPISFHSTVRHIVFRKKKKGQKGKKVHVFVFSSCLQRLRNYFVDLG